jgi:Ca-activated chloride channel family protein
MLSRKNYSALLALLSLVSVTLATTSIQETSLPSQTSQAVRLSLIVTDRSNHSVDELQKEDVHVVDEGVPQTVSALARDERPTYYALVLDNSGSFRDVLQRAVEAAKLIVESNRLEDETFVERFINSKKIETVQEFTSEKKLLTGGLDTLYVEGGQSAVIDALYLAIDHTAKYRSDDKSHRRVVIVFTDCEERASYYSSKQLIKLIRDSKVQVFVVGITYLLDRNSGLLASPQEKAEIMARKIAEESGDRFFFPENAKQLLETTRQIIHDLHTQFTISYDRQGKPSDKTFREVKVAITGSGQLKAIVARGYSISPSAQIQKGDARKNP